MPLDKPITVGYMDTAHVGDSDSTYDGQYTCFSFFFPFFVPLSLASPPSRQSESTRRKTTSLATPILMWVEPAEEQTNTSNKEEPKHLKLFRLWTQSELFHHVLRTCDIRHLLPMMYPWAGEGGFGVRHLPLGLWPFPNMMHSQFLCTHVTYSKCLKCEWINLTWFNQAEQVQA